MRNNPLYRSCKIFIFMPLGLWELLFAVVAARRSDFEVWLSEPMTMRRGFIVLRKVMIYPRPSYFRLLWGLVYFLVLFLREDIDHFGFLPRSFTGW